MFDGLRSRIAVAVAPTIEALANAFVALASDGGILRSAIDALIGNLGRFASYELQRLPPRWPGAGSPGWPLRPCRCAGLATALVFLRGALIRTGIGALIVGAGELVYQFSQPWPGSQRGRGVPPARRSGARSLVAHRPVAGRSLCQHGRWMGGAEGGGGLSALEGTIAGVVSFGDRTAAMFQGAYDAAVAIWGSLPGAIGDFAFQAANGLILASRRC